MPLLTVIDYPLVMLTDLKQMIYTSIYINSNLMGISNMCIYPIVWYDHVKVTVQVTIIMIS